MSQFFDLASLLGYSGVLCNIVWPLFRGRTTMLIVQGLGAVGFALHYLFLGAETASLLLTMAALQAFVAIPLGKRAGFRVVYLATIPAIALIMALSWHGTASLFASLGLATISLGRYQLDVVRFRALLVACIPFWVVHNLIVWSVPGLMSDATSFAAGAWMLAVTMREERAIRTAGVQT